MSTNTTTKAIPTGYVWTITIDKLGDGEDVGTYGPRGATLDGVKLDKAFRLLDDDGEVYYHGKYAGPDDESLFAPLDDFGMPNAGCTTIEYYDPQSRKWEAI